MDAAVELAIKNEKRLGCGTRSEVFELDDNWVVKVMHTEDDGFWAVVNMTDTCREKLCMPRIDVSRSDLDNGVIVIERLVRMDYSLWTGTDNVHTITNDFHRSRYYERFGFDINKWLNDDHPLYDITLKAVHAWKVMRRVGYILSLDINPSNIMVRPSDRKMVLSDPFGFIDM